MSQLYESHIFGLSDIELCMVDDHEREVYGHKVEEVNYPMETQTSMKKARSMNYRNQEDIYLCLARVNFSLDALVGMDQMREKF